MRRKPAPAKPKEEPKKRPVIKYQDGQIKISVWENEGEYGKMYSAIIKRVYKKEGKDWEETDNIDYRDLLPLSEGLKAVHAEIVAIKGHGITESPLNSSDAGDGDESEADESEAD